MKKRNILETKIVKHYLNLSLNHFAENIKKKKKKTSTGSQITV